MRFGSLCSGIEAASVAWLPLGWECAWLAEIEPFPCAVLAHHYPETVNLGDLNSKSFYFSPRNRAWYDDFDFEEKAKCLNPVDLICGGTPCQAFSVAGLRQSLDDERGNLTLRFVEIVNATDPRFVLWENVPGVLSTRDNAFGCLLAGLVGEDAPIVPTGGRWTDAGVVDGPRRSLAWRILDAQYFGLAQRRRRVFVLAGRAGGRPHPAEVLFEPDRLPRHHPPGRGKGEDVAGTLKACARSGGWSNSVDHAAAGYMQVAHTLRGRGFDASEDGTGRGTPLVPVAFPAEMSGTQCATAQDRAPALSVGHTTAIAFDTTQITSAANYSTPVPGDPCHPLAAGAHPPAVAFESRFVRNGRGAPAEIVPPLKAQSGQTGKGDAAPLVALTAGDRGISVDQACAGMIQPAGPQVRRLTPRECERLQGFPDDYTLVPYHGKPAEDCPDGPRYKGLGNSWAVNVARWIGERINKMA